MEQNKIPYIKMNNITKRFGKVIANNNINLEVYGGEVHALLGENGAGKSTLMNMLSGVYTPDGGSILVHGKEVKFASPKDAIDSGIGMIYQHFKLVDNMTAVENIIFGQKGKLFLNKKKNIQKIQNIIDKFNLEVELNKSVYEMSVGEKQNLEILKVLYRGANILILDEPTAVFTPQESEKLFKIIDKMKSEGCAVIFITHKMDEVMKMADRITILRKGETIKTVNKKDSNPKELTELMVGRSVELSIKTVPFKKENKLLEVKNLKVLNEDKLEIIKNINFDVFKGEILGIAGVAGSGQKELCEAIAGIHKIKDGEIIFEGENIEGQNPRDIITKGISMSFIPEDRLGMGLVASMDMVDNILLKNYQSQKGMFIKRKPIEAKAKEMVSTLEIKTPSINYPIRYLSGGNIQKILLGRELSLNPKLLIMAYPVRGLDVNTCYTIYELINEEKKKGSSIIYIGEDLDVLMELCDRVMVMYNGEITGILNAKNTSREEIGMLMVGKKLEEEALDA
ncbi:MULTISPECIES: ABC transporter ATP-binding protein [Clostridium]|uniref:ABC transporter, ATP-binding protein n=1 Tax=Clostridium novyi (strain NT) TaxID=386415 RepID=A0Q2P0_CLONN|nr:MULTISPECIES: ABC transporter ATP-binding protein [Clostridium]ABK62441.1 ABC transporter, ATP-binding protein [Clostridium novyi NT]KEH85752.1 ABC transporter ATP-binding protein [Clostridium novyi A str. NCTC 538]KEH89697.1 ABC transporter ATP-binding protein [Clostridium novyi A str. 4540]KEH90326.1 ABC transporter ATP-binding protein [Clostridium novyi A str. BKT29909]KEH93569.1 ABC transporter ATP-binding protein [Clostridium botulinum C/D str. It1]